MLVHWGGQVLREERYHPILYTEPSLRHGKTNRRGREAFAHRIHCVIQLRRVRRPPSLSYHPAVTRKHETVQLMFALSEGIEEGQDAGRGHAFRLGRASRKPGIAVRLAGGPTTERNQTQPSRAETELFEKGPAICCHALRISSCAHEIQAWPTSTH